MMGLSLADALLNARCGRYVFFRLSDGMILVFDQRTRIARVMNEDAADAFYTARMARWPRNPSRHFDSPMIWTWRGTEHGMRLSSAWRDREGHVQRFTQGHGFFCASWGEGRVADVGCFYIFRIYDRHKPTPEPVAVTPQTADDFLADLLG